MQTAPQDLLLGTAERRLLEPYELEPGKLERVFGALGAHRIDYADLYFQYSRSESWSLEEGIVKSGSFNIEQGVGVRAIAGEKTAFAYSDEISFDALEDAARATRAIAAAGQARRTRVARRGRQVRRYEPVDPLATLGSDAKVALLEKLERMCRALDPRVTQVMAQLGGEYKGPKIDLIWRNLDADQAPAQAQEFVNEHVDVIVAFEDTSIRAAKAATSTPGNRIPVVFLHPSDPVRDDLVKSLSNPGGNLTGVFGARMDVELVNDGPVTIILDA